MIELVVGYGFLRGSGEVVACGDGDRCAAGGRRRGAALQGDEAVSGAVRLKQIRSARGTIGNKVKLQTHAEFH